MLNFSLTRLDRSIHGPLAANAVVADEGMALIAVDDGSGQFALQASTGAAGEAFYGVSLFERRNPATLSNVLVLAGTGAEFTEVISNYIDGSARITLIAADGTRSALDGTTPEASIAANGTVTVLDTVPAGTSVEVVYTYTPTQTQIISAQGEASILSAAPPAEMGALKSGVVYTTCFDTAAAWAVGDVPKLGANGQFVLGGTGADCVGCIVVSLPTATNPQLGIELS